MKILFQIPSLDTIYAGRNIFYGYKHAFEDLGHSYKPFTLDSNPYELFDAYRPDIFIGGFGPLAFKYLDFDLIRKHKKRGMKVFVNIPFWKSPMSKLRINETSSISDNSSYVKLIKSGVYGDIYFNVCESDDLKMEGFEKATGYKHITLPLAADKTLHFPEFTPKFKTDISFIGTNLPQKRQFIKEYVRPLENKYILRLYGQDWSFIDRNLGYVQKVGQYFNIPLLRSLRKPKLKLEDERRIYASSLISINFHEDYQREYGGECNERTFKIPASGGFEITDNVACIKKYFKEGKEIIIAYNKKDWFDKIDYYLRNPEKRLSIIEAGRKKVLKYHTYHNRVQQLLKVYKVL